MTQCFFKPGDKIQYKLSVAREDRSVYTVSRVAPSNVKGEWRLYVVESHRFRLDIHVDKVLPLSPFEQDLFEYVEAQKAELGL